jgi:hypothetical protein
MTWRSAAKGGAAMRGWQGGRKPPGRAERTNGGRLAGLEDEPITRRVQISFDRIHRAMVAEAMHISFMNEW